MAYTTIDDPEVNFFVKLVTGNSTSNNDDPSNQQTITGLKFQPDWLWGKNRNQGDPYYHVLVDSVRGSPQRLYSNNSNAESTDDGDVENFTSDGFKLGSGLNLNANGDSNVFWLWKAGGSASSNSNGTITSSVSVSTDAGFSIVTYTGNGTAGATIGHGLGSVPKWIIVKVRNTTNEWVVYHTSLGATKFIEMNSSGASQTNSTRFNDTEPTSSVFSVGTAAGLNTNNDTHVAYCFAEKKGYSKFGSYTGNGNADGPFVYTGFKPAWVLIKVTSTTNDWEIHDNKRQPFNEMNAILQPNLSDAETPSSQNRQTDFLSNGFKLRNGNTQNNLSGGSFIYMAFAESPFVNSNGVPNNAR